MNKPDESEELGVKLEVGVVIIGAEIKI